jgi:glycosyltransferase involved in cell wall biosynthesis
MQNLNSKSINVLFLIYDLERGGPELRLLDFAKYFPKDINVHICVTSEKLALFDKFKAHHARVKVIAISKIYFSILKILKISLFCKRSNSNIINVFDLKGLVIASIIKLIVCFRCKIVYHNVNSLVEFSSKQLSFFCLLSRLLHRCVCNSRFSKNEIEKIIPTNKIQIIHNGLDLQFFKKNAKVRKLTRAGLNIQKDEIVLGIIANFRKQKNYPFLLKAFGILSNRHDCLKLLCVGGGEYLAQSKSIVTKKNLRQKIIFTGYTEHVVEYLSAMDILVLPSLWEGLPNAIMQGMSMEIPVVVSNVGGCAEMVRHMENGMLFPSDEIHEFTSHLETLINDKNLANKLGQNARKTIEKEFSMDRMINKYSTFYKKLAVS